MIITPLPGDDETSLLTPLVFTVHDNQTDYNEYIDVKVYTNDTDDVHWEDLTTLYNVPSGKHPGEEVYIPTDTLSPDNHTFFDEYNTTYYWKVTVKDNDKFPSDQMLDDIAPFTTEKIYKFKTIKET